MGLGTFILGFGLGVFAFPLLVLLALSGRLDQIIDATLTRLEEALKAVVSPVSPEVAEVLAGKFRRLAFGIRTKTRSTQKIAVWNDSQEADSKTLRGRTRGHPCGAESVLKAGWIRVERTSRLQQLLELERSKPPYKRLFEFEQEEGTTAAHPLQRHTRLHLSGHPSDTDERELALGLEEDGDDSKASAFSSQGSLLTSLWPNKPKTSRAATRTERWGFVFGVLKNDCLSLYNDDLKEHCLGTIALSFYHVVLFPDNLQENQCFSKDFPIWLRNRDGYKASSITSVGHSDSVPEQQDSMCIRTRAHSQSSHESQEVGRSESQPLAQSSFQKLHSAVTDLKSPVSTGVETRLQPVTIIDQPLRRRNLASIQPTEKDPSPPEKGVLSSSLAISDFLLYASSSVEKEEWFFLLRRFSNPRQDTPSAQFERDWAKLESVIEGLSRASDRVEESMCARKRSHREDGSTSPKSFGHVERAETPEVAPAMKVENCDWLNAFFGRIFLGIYEQPEARQLIEAKYTRKLKQIQLPSYFEGTEISSLSLGHTLPILTNPKLLSVQPGGEINCSLELAYSGGCRIEISTNVVVQLPQAVSNLTSKFGTATDGAFRVNLRLAVTVNHLQGRILVKIRRPPSNRMWLGFFQMPELRLDVTPIVSTRHVKWSVLKEIIEKRFKDTVASIFVLPNMDDISFWPSGGRGMIPNLQDLSRDGIEAQEVHQRESEDERQRNVGAITTLLNKVSWPSGKDTAGSITRRGEDVRGLSETTTARIVAKARELANSENVEEGTQAIGSLFQSGLQLLKNRAHRNTDAEPPAARLSEESSSQILALGELKVESSAEENESQQRAGGSSMNEDPATVRFLRPDSDSPSSSAEYQQGGMLARLRQRTEKVQESQALQRLGGKAKSYRDRLGTLWANRQAGTQQGTTKQETGLTSSKSHPSLVDSHETEKPSEGKQPPPMTWPLTSSVGESANPAETGAGTREEVAGDANAQGQNSDALTIHPAGPKTTMTFRDGGGPFLAGNGEAESRPPGRVPPPIPPRPLPVASGLSSRLALPTQTEPSAVYSPETVVTATTNAGTVGIGYCEPLASVSKKGGPGSSHLLYSSPADVRGLNSAPASLVRAAAAPTASSRAFSHEGASQRRPATLHSGSVGSQSADSTRRRVDLRGQRSGRSRSFRYASAVSSTPTVAVAQMHVASSGERKRRMSVATASGRSTTSGTTSPSLRTADSQVDRRWSLSEAVRRES